jgi:hypothetical protein
MGDPPLCQRIVNRCKKPRNPIYINEYGLSCHFGLYVESKWSATRECRASDASGRDPERGPEESIMNRALNHRIRVIITIYRGMVA